MLKFPNMEILKVRFNKDSKKVIIATSCGLIFLYHISDMRLERIFSQTKYPMVTCIKYIDEGS